MTKSISNTSFTQQSWLDWTQRPDELNRDITHSIEKLKRFDTSSWKTFNGLDFYGILNVDEKALFKNIILQNYPKEKEFYVLDIGAGNFQWSKAVAEFIEQQTDLPNDIKVHIIGIRGEGYWGQRVVETERCKIYNLGAFKVEELFAKFKEQGLDLKNKVHMAVSHWCCRHLNDPVGTFAQIFNLLRPRIGYVLVDGFFFLRNMEGMDDVDFNRSMTQLFIDTKAPFLTKENNIMRSLNHFVLRRPDETPCQIPMSYIGICQVGDGWQIGSEKVTRFKREPQQSDNEKFNLPDRSECVVGDKTMYEWLKQNGLFDYPDVKWKPLREKDDHLMQPLLHKVVLYNDVMKVEELLEQGNDINESDSDGCTPLHLTIQKKFFEVFQFLLKRGARTDLYNGKKRAALDEAAFADTQGEFLQALIDVRAPVNPKGYGKKAPLKSAIEAKNPKAVELLIKNGAEVSDDDYRTLRDPAFLSLHQKGIISYKSTVGGLSEVYDWIKKGDCVVLHYQGCDGVTYHYPNEHNTNPQLHVVEINPQDPLLAEGEWPAFLKAWGYESVPYDKEKIKQANFKEQNHYQFGYEDDAN